MVKASGSKQQVEDTLRKLVDEIPKRFHSYIELGKIESLRYPSLLQEIQSAFISFSTFTDSVQDVKKADWQGEETPEVIAKAEILYEQLQEVASRLDRIGNGYQSVLNKKVIEYANGMDEQYTAFYALMADNLHENIRKRNVSVPARGPMENHARIPGVIEGFEGPYKWGKLFLTGTLPPTGDFEDFQRIIVAYDKLLDEAQKLWDATKDTPLNTSGLYAVLFQHRVLFKGDGGPHIGGKRGKINIDYQMMEMVADKDSIFQECYIK